jgi:uncharacterized protein YndB with AHSA1/START domain
LSNAQSISIDVEIAAPPDVVFTAWTNPDHLAEWLADTVTVDARVGGSYRLETEGPEEMPGLHICSGTYREIVPNKRIVKTWKYEAPDDGDDVNTLVSIDLEPTGFGTLMRFSESGDGLETDEDREFSVEAWTGAFDALRALVED